jgi:hypothetical protein
MTLNPGDDAFRAEVVRKANERGCEGLRDWQVRFPGEHLVATKDSLHVCAICGKVQPYDGFKTLCPGRVAITTRRRATNGRT